ncbi:MAG: hypothetical protein CBC16_01660 [Verrucomicrobia bacterium TMED56]|nr:MAG: hypothetical protein CBC16_01660 [Verrucomicrobia bacterium TMED56]
MIFRYFHTIRYLKFKQIYYRFWFHFIKPIIRKNLQIDLRVIENEFCSPIKKKISLLNENTFQFLNKSQSLSEVGWNEGENTISKLWCYNQHYFDDLNAFDSFKRKTWHDQLLERWINENRIGKGIGWDPYPTSLRIVNWVKWHLQGNKLSEASLQSLALQANWLNKRIEWHILGNHLFSNAKALIFVGLFFSSKQSEIWLKKGLKIMNDELKEQVLKDGGHFELSPMYHAIFLEDLLDLINIFQAYSKVIQNTQVNECIKIAKRMLNWLEVMTHPDGDIAFFNDAALEIAPNLDELKKYAQRLQINNINENFNQITYLSDSGYVRYNSNHATALLDVALIGPNYQPGHAHADSLSFEFSLFGQRLLVNSGTSEYGINPVRQHERSTKAHNTVQVNNKDSSEVWSGFRVARRAYPFDLKIEELENFVNISCAHDGYKRLNGNIIHKRHWQFSKNSLIIKDQINGSFESAYAYFHFHPSVVIKKNKNFSWKIEMPNGQQVILQVRVGETFVEKSYYSSEFGKKFDSQCLKVALDKREGSCLQILWNDQND